MLKYLITVTGNLFSTSFLIGLLFAYVFLMFGKRGRKILAVGAIAGTLAAILMSVLKNTTKLIHTGLWNSRIFAVSLVILLLYYIVSIRGVRRKLGRTGETILPVLCGLLAFTFLFYALPDVFAYPFNFALGGESTFSTAFLYRFIGYLLGILLGVIACFATERSARKLKPGTAAIFLNLVLLVNAIQQSAKILQELLAQRRIVSQFLFTMVRYAANYSNCFIYAALVVVLIIPIVLWVRSFRVRESYENPAQRRQIRAKWRTTRRWATTLIVCLMLVVLNLTVFAAVDNRPVELSPAEDCEVRGDSVYVALTQVEDGHLHRFVYTTENGVGVRFIVIKKPNATSYGVGLDACDICGETGYYERSGQIVCKLCDVVMNINTIGFKGGCNPIVIDYSVEGGYIIIPVDTLVAHEKEFAG